jgi:hypothetical protein
MYQFMYVKLFHMYLKYTLIHLNLYLQHSFQNKNEILQLLTNIFTNGNGRFNRLRTYVWCTEHAEEIAENNIESLMSNVSRNLMTDYKPEL